MNDINAILHKIEEDAKTQAAAILETAEKNCAKIKADYLREAEKQGKAILTAANAQADAARLRTASQSGIEQRNLKLEARRSAIDAAFEKAMEKLCNMSDEQKIALYSEMVLQSISGDAFLVMNVAERAAIGDAVVKLVSKRLINSRQVIKVTLADDFGKFRGGIQLREGNIETNCTFEVLIKQAKEELEPEVARVLFDD